MWKDYYKYIKYTFLLFFIMFFLFIFTFAKDWFKVDQSDIDTKDIFYTTLNKTWPLLELKLSVNSAKNGKSAVDIFMFLEKFLIKKINKLDNEVSNNKYLILLFFIQNSIENLLEDSWSNHSNNNLIDTILNQLSDIKNNDDDQKTRGIWFWSNSNLDWWLFNVIWDKDKENEVITDLQEYNIARVYGSYSRSLSINQDFVAQWNIKLHDVWIKSDLLIWDSFSSVIDNKDKFFLKIQNNFLNFNQSRSNNAEKFDDIHLDIEPQWMDNRSNLSLYEKKWYLYELLLLFKDLRDYLDVNNGDYVDIYIDLAHWFGNLNSIWWDDEQERNDRFLDIDKQVDWVTLMTYENDNLDTLVRWASDERDLLWEKVRLSLDCDMSLNSVWDNFYEFTNMFDKIEKDTNYSLDIHSYSTFKQSLLDFD